MHPPEVRKRDAEGRSGWFRFHEFDRFLALALELTGDPAFGLHWGERSPMFQFGPAPSMLALAPTLDVALRAFSALQPCLISRDLFAVVTRGDRCVLRLSQTDTESTTERAWVELTIASIVRAIRYLGAGDAILRVSFSHRRPSYGAEYDRFVGRVLFEQTRAGIELSRTALHRERPNGDAEQVHQLLRHAQALHERALAKSSFAEQVASRIRSALPRALPLAEAARLLGLSARSLHRRLAEHGLSFSVLVDDVRCARARELMGTGTMSSDELANALGFETRGGFHRALRRWRDAPQQTIDQSLKCQARVRVG